MKDFIRSWWFLGLILVFTAFVIVLCVVAITTHTEPGLMARRPGFTRSDLPIPVTVHAYHGDLTEDEHAHDDALRATSRAVDTINERLGFQALEVQTHPYTALPVIGVEIGVPTEHSAADGVVIDPGGAALFHPGDRECYVTTSNTGTDALLDLVLQQELGHCLGLDHDDYGASIMCGGERCTLTTPPAGSYAPRISDDDRNTLRALYQ